MQTGTIVPKLPVHTKPVETIFKSKFNLGRRDVRHGNISGVYAGASTMGAAIFTNRTREHAKVHREGVEAKKGFAFVVTDEGLDHAHIGGRQCEICKARKAKGYGTRKMSSKADGNFGTRQGDVVRVTRSIAV